MELDRGNMQAFLDRCGIRSFSVVNHLRWDLKAVCEVPDLRERTFCRLAIYAEMRPGQIIALRWPDIKDGYAFVDDRYYKGEQDDTKNRKPRMVALSPVVQRDLTAWCAFAISEDSFVFPSDNFKTPIKYENLWQRKIKPRFAKNRLGLGRFPLYAQNKLHAYESGRCRSESIGRQPGPRPCVAMQEYTHSTDEQKARLFKNWKI